MNKKMEYFKKTEVIRCYRERKEDRCAECRLAQAVRKMPNGIDENMEALVREVLDPVRRKMGKPIVVNSGFRCPLHNGRVGGASGSQHMKGEAADVRCEDNARLAKIIKENGQFDQMIIYPTFVHVSYKRTGENRKEILKKVGNGYQRVDVKELGKA